MQKITPCLWFDKDCEEAINFYTSTFRDSKIISIKRYPDEQLEGPPPGMAGKILTAIFDIKGTRFMALDGGPYFKPTEATSFQVECEDQEEVDLYTDKISADKSAEQCGWIKDKYGFSWQIIPKRLIELLDDEDKAKANRVLHAMLKMKRINVAELEAAAEAR
jgi:predicted 3-demethylubiquinone-9 3-methyltransferase (glyoxalase superfamily)